MTEQTKTLLASKNTENEVLEDKVKSMNEDIKNITLILAQMKDGLDIHEEKISNDNRDEAIDDMNVDIENATVAINELTAEVNKIKVGANAAFKSHASIINKVSHVVYNLDSDLYEKVFSITE